jgi:hypothetical protein
MTQAEKRSSLIKIAFIVFITGALLNTILMKNNIGGLLRELTRLVTLLGMILIVVGLVYKFMPKKK